MITDLFSPGSQMADRHRLELRMQRAADPAARAFLDQVGRVALSRSGEFSAGWVRGEWAKVTMALLDVQATFLGLPHPKPQTPLTDDRLRASAQRLTDLPIAAQAYTSALAVMTTEPTASAMRAALNIDEGQTLVTAAPEPPQTLTAALDLITKGRTWATTIAAAVRTEATIAFNTEVIRRVLRLSRADKAADIVWVAHHDGRTRPSHLAADGQRAKPGGLYQVGDEWLRYPGDPAGSVSETIECRCALSARYLADLTRRSSSLGL